MTKKYERIVYYDESGSPKRIDIALIRNNKEELRWTIVGYRGINKELKNYELLQHALTGLFK